MIQQDQGDLAEARESMERALAIQAQHFGPDHPTFATSYSNLAAIQREQGDLRGACLSLKKALPVALKDFGETDWRVGAIRRAMRDMGCTEEQSHDGA